MRKKKVAGLEKDVGRGGGGGVGMGEHDGGGAGTGGCKHSCAGARTCGATAKKNRVPSDDKTHYC